MVVMRVTYTVYLTDAKFLAQLDIRFCDDYQILANLDCCVRGMYGNIWFRVPNYLEQLFHIPMPTIPKKNYMH